MSRMQLVERDCPQLGWTTLRPTDRLTDNFCWLLLVLVSISLVPFFLRRHFTNQLQMERSSWIACARRISCLVLKSTRCVLGRTCKFGNLRNLCYIVSWLKKSRFFLLCIFIEFSTFCFSGFGSSTRIKQWILVPRFGWIGVKICWILQARCSICQVVSQL